MTLSPYRTNAAVLDMMVAEGADRREAEWAWLSFVAHAERGLFRRPGLVGFVAHLRATYHPAWAAQLDAMEAAR